MGFNWQEITSGLGDVPAWTLAGRSDEAVSSRGEAVAALVQWGTQALNDHSVNYAINSHKEELEQERLPIVFEGHRTGGVLVVAELMVQQYGEMSGRRFNYLSDFPGIFSRPQHAIYRWSRMRRAQGSLSAGWGRTEYRFFWVTQT